ncbi:MAG TPA: adenylate/guanylate cyclase domain-containing protein [Stellaceae bacterium]|nr:adenylate/guanylate cyclase domain-containing protein [Stellaceae bacterium]
MVSDAPPPRPSSFDGVLGRQIIALHVWAVGQGLRGVTADLVMDGLCRRLVEAGVPLWRAFAGMRTLHPQWGGYGYTWRRDLNTIQPEQYERGSEYEQNWLESPFAWLVSQEAARADGTPPWPSLRRRLAGPEAQLDFPVLRGVSAAGGTDYFAHLVMFGAQGDASRGSGVGISFTTDRPEGFDDDHIVLLRAVLPAASLALMADAGHTIASGLLAAYLGADAGKRVHQGAVARGSVEAIRAVLWYADIRGFTAIADRNPGLAVIEMLDEAFETLTAALRAHGGQVLKFIGDGMLAIFPFVEGTREETCGHALDAAAEAMRAVDRLNEVRGAAGKPVAAVDLALHLGEVLYGNVGAADRLDFTVIGPAVNEAARIETLCEPLGYPVLVSAELAAATANSAGLKPLGRHRLRGVREAREIYALDLGG